MKEVNIKDMSIEALKAMVYDNMVTAQQAQNNIKALETEIIARNEKPVEEKKK